MSDFDRRLDELKRGTDGLRAPEGFDVTMQAKLVAAAALPPAVAGAALSFAARWLIGVLAFAGAAVGVWWATTSTGREPEPPTPALVGQKSEPVSEAHRPPPPPPRVEPPAQVPSANGLAPGLTADEPAPPYTWEFVDGGYVVHFADGGTSGFISFGVEAAGGPVGTPAKAPVTRSSGRTPSCDGRVGLVELQHFGDVAAALKAAGDDAAQLKSEIATALAADVDRDGATTLAVGRFISDQGPGFASGLAGDVHLAGAWFAVGGRAGDHVEIVADQYRPIALAFDRLPPGRHYVGDVMLDWVGSKPGSGYTFQYGIMGNAEPATVFLYPMACSRSGGWKPALAPSRRAVLAPLGRSSTVELANLSHTKYVMALLSPGSLRWSTEAGDGDAVQLPVAPDREVKVDFVNGDANGRIAADTRRVMLSRGFTLLPDVTLELIPGSETGAWCVPAALKWRVFDLGEGAPLARPARLPPNPQCVQLGHTMYFEELGGSRWVVARFSR